MQGSRGGSWLRNHGGGLRHLVPGFAAGRSADKDLATPSHWYRIFLPELLPELDRVLYLDADVIVVDSLIPLWNVDLSEDYLAAVTNVFQAAHVHRPVELGLAGPRAYFNSGVMVLNLE